MQGSSAELSRGQESLAEEIRLPVDPSFSEKPSLTSTVIQQQETTPPTQWFGLVIYQFRFFTLHCWHLKVT